MIFAGERLKITLPARDGREEIYTVKRGDTPISIAGKHGVSLSALEHRNGLRRGETIYAGEKLIIPGAKMSGEFYAVRPGDTLWSISGKNRRCVGGAYRNKRDKRPRFDIRGGAY